MKYIKVDDYAINLKHLIFLQNVSNDNYYTRLGINTRIHTVSAVLDVKPKIEVIEYAILKVVNS